MKRLVSLMILGAFLAGAQATEARERGARKPINEAVPDGIARLVALPERDGSDGTIVVPVTIDLQDVTVNERPAVLGAYVVKVEFDPNKVGYGGVRGGLDPYFATDPFATNTAKANRDGVVRISSVQTNVLLPIGMVNVARLTFVEKVQGGADSIKLTMESVASALEKDENGTYLRNLEINTGKDVHQ